MIKYGYWPTVDEKVATAERRLMRLRQMEGDARVILRRRVLQLRLAQQSDMVDAIEVQKACVAYQKAMRNLREVINAVMEQASEVRYLRTGTRS